jgi:transcriptional regulator with XRE-family HTH domain
MMLVRAELCGRLESLQTLSRRLSARDFTESVDSIRRLAAAYGMTPVVRLAEALERAVGEGGPRGCPASLYLSRLQDAIGCERTDEAAGEAMLASVSVRLC